MPRGGVRPGAGRPKRKGPRAVCPSVYLDVQLVAKLKRIAQHRNLGSVSAALRSVVEEAHAPTADELEEARWLSEGEENA